MSGYTKGPWYYTDSASGHTWWIETDADTAETAVATAWRSEADARLMAAAPSMYEALKAMLDPNECTRDVDMALAALHEAEGRDQ